MKRIVIITGFEAFNASLYRDAAQKAIARCPDLEVLTFNDRDLVSQPDAVVQALQGADVLFASLIFDYDQVIWLRERVENIPVRLVFESALELMALTRLGKFIIGEQPKGMPKPIKFILSKFTNSKEEDKLAGYLSFLKTGPKLLKYIPAKKVQDLRNWLIIYGYWNAGGTDNVAAMCWAIAANYLGLEIGELPAVVETPNLGLLHPDHDGYFLSPQAYLDWHHRIFPEQKLNPVVAVLLYRKHVVTKQPYIPQLIRKFEADGLVPLPIFINGVEAHVIVRDWLTTDYEQHQRLHGQVAIKSLKADAVRVEGIVSTIGFPLVGGPAGSMEAGRQVEVAKSILTAKNIPYLVAAPLLIQDLHSWTRQGIGGLQSVVLYALPELDGAIDTIPLGGLVGEDIYLIPERIKRLTGRLKNWIRLKNTAPGDRQLAILLYGFPPGYGATGTAALLNVPKSLVNLLKTLQAQGYDVGNFPEDGEEIIRLVKAADEAYRLDPALAPQQTLENIDLKTMDRWLGYLLTQKIEKQWQSLTNTGLKTFGGKCQVGGVQFGKVWIGVQPPLGISGDPMRLMFEKDLTPHPQYAAFYKWLQNEFRADALIHFGMHGTVEWLPGSPLGNTSYSWSDILLGNLPNLYIYAANNPSESILAKRRGYGTLISHNVPPYGRAGLYKELLVLRDLIGEYREDPEKNDALRPDIIQKIVDLGLPEDCPFTVGQEQGSEFTVENAPLFSKTALQNYFVHIYEYLQTLEQRLFSSGLHVLGEKPSPEIIQSYLAAYFGDRLPENVLTQVAQGEQEITCNQPELLAEAREIGDRLLQTDDEMTNLLKGLNGEYIPPAPGGDLLRDGLGVLPTGRNIHALDPYRMPSPAAYARGREIGKKIIQQHLEETGNYPETVAVMLWGLDAIKTKGESLGILLELVGAEPIKEGTGRIVRYELLPLAVVGHPRIDILANLSGIFRDSFVNIIELLDDLFHRAATVDEDPAQNFIRKHSLELQAEGVENTTARLFSNPAGDFGSLVNDQIVEGNWDNSDELAKTWEGRNQYSYGRNDKGQARPEVLKKLLQTGDRLVQEIDSVEYGLTDIQEYYANTGGLKKAAENASGKTVTASFVESFSKDTTPRKLESVLRMEYRSKLLNPKWAEAMADQGSGGAYEISQRMTALIGWGGTVDFQDQWVYDQAAETYALDATMAQKLRDANPEAFRNIVGRMLEAHGRGFWEASDEKLQKLSDLYDLTDDVLEGITT
ncbi:MULTISPECIES: magnesium chelatase subunit H [unclassified Picosynechococcus]|uniref:magnesium chelatase subunit H n=3 Tax=Cyanophyceae TaxID=3028117 RepID=UPI00016DC581|nr:MULTISPECIES: magnesium chelatase subunit H [unclassified Picosynechococcus]ACA99003.1 magnesium-chelatase, subunit H [Picosynechococcus sp. PCC 7002]SMH35895.1 cobaltochelatase CobN subunit [Picosynechococcus sp. OG1]